MSNELREAAERLRSGNYPDSHDTPDGYVSETRTADFWTVTEAYLAEHPASDELAIDEPWLRSIGFRSFADEFLLDLMDDQSFALQLMLTESGWLPFIIHRETDESMRTKLCTTRGQLRRLLSALGAE